MKDNNGVVYKLNKDDPKCNELDGITKDTVAVKDKLGNKLRVSKTDPRYLSGELLANSRGYKSYHHPISKHNISCYPGNQPEGYILGMAPNSKPPISEETREKMRISSKTRKNKDVVYKCIGESNPSTKHITVYDKDHNIVFVSKGAFPKFCKDNKLPYNALVNTYKNNTVINRVMDKEMYGLYIGWYARISSNK